METSYTYVFWLSDYKYDHENRHRNIFKVKTQKNPVFQVFHITSIGCIFFFKNRYFSSFRLASCALF